MVEQGYRPNVTFQRNWISDSEFFNSKHIILDEEWQPLVQYGGHIF